MATNAERKASKVRETIDGTEKLCTKCVEWWPADGEFFFTDKEGILGLLYCCKACYYEMDKRPGRKGAQRAAELRP